MQGFKEESLQIGHIELVNNPIKAAQDFYVMQNPQDVRLFCADELNIEMARLIIDESYIANNGVKTILIAALSFNEYAQNALLKILEEPPSGVLFIIYARMKFLLLPTIRSRLPILNHSHKQRLEPALLDIKTMDLKSVYLFLKELQEKEREGNDNIKREIQSLYLDSIKFGLNFTQNEAELFEKALKWEAQHERGTYILLVLLLLILKKKKHKFSNSISR